MPLISKIMRFEVGLDLEMIVDMSPSSFAKIGLCIRKNCQYVSCVGKWGIGNISATRIQSEEKH